MRSADFSGVQFGNPSGRELPLPVGGPSFLGLGDDSSSDLDYLLDDEPPLGHARMYLALLLLLVSAGLLAWHWQRDGYPWDAINKGLHIGKDTSPAQPTSAVTAQPPPTAASRSTRALRRSRVAKLEPEAEATKAELAAVLAVVEVFRDPDRCFLTPPWPQEIQPDDFLDISHESLIRHWGRLRAWVGDEAASAEDYRRLDHGALVRRPRQPLGHP